MTREEVKKYILKYERILSWIYRLFYHNCVKVSKGSAVSYKGTFMKHCRIKVSGYGNEVCIESGITRLTGVNIVIMGNHCKVHIGPGCNLNESTLYIEDDYGVIDIKKHVTITGKTNLSVIEGTKICIGEDCLFSSEISFRTGDSHSIINSKTGERINPSKNIYIGNHVWIGHHANILKGAVVQDNSIIAAGSIVTGKSYPNNCIVGGVPGIILKEGVTWDAHRLPI